MSEVIEVTTPDGRWCLRTEHVDALISTVRLPMMHMGGMWFESMVFASEGHPLADHQERYATSEEARDGHYRLKGMLDRDALCSGDDIFAEEE